MGAAERARGARAEVAVVNFLRANGWPDARRYLAGDGRQPGDVDFHPLVALEVKDVARSAWPSWCRQAASEAREGMVPAVVRRTRGVADPGLWECRVHGNDWLLATFDDLDDDHYPFCIPSVAFGHTKADIDGWWWYCTTLAEFVAALRRFDTLDGAA